MSYDESRLRALEAKAEQAYDAMNVLAFDRADRPGITHQQSS